VLKTKKRVVVATRGEVCFQQLKIINFCWEKIYIFSIHTCNTNSSKYFKCYSTVGKKGYEIFADKKRLITDM